MRIETGGALALLNLKYGFAAVAIRIHKLAGGLSV